MSSFIAYNSMPSNTARHQRSLATKVVIRLDLLQLYNESPWDVVVTIQWHCLQLLQPTTKPDSLELLLLQYPQERLLFTKLVNTLTDIHLMLHAVICTCVTIGILINHHLRR